MLIKLLRWLRGQVEFTAEGAGIEAFFRLAGERHIPLRQLSREKERLSGITVPSQYRALAYCAKHSGMRLRHHGKRGLPFVLHRYKKRWGLLAGACFFLVFLLASQNFVWSIEIENYGGKQEEYLRQAMADSGLHIGAYLPDMNLRAVRDQVLARVNDLSWLTFTREGTTIRVDLSPKVPQPIMDQSDPCNLVALKDGKIVSTSVLRGQAVVEKNQVVHAGDLLISGIDQLPKGDILTVHAQGQVIAETVNTKEISFSLQQTEPNYNGKQAERRYLEFFGLQLPLFIAFDLPYASEMTESYQPAFFFGTELPMGIRTQHHRFYEPVEKSYSQQEARQMIEEAFSVYETEDLKNAEILGYTEEWIQEGQKLICRRKYQCREDIAREMALSVNDSQKK